MAKHHPTRTMGTEKLFSLLIMMLAVKSGFAVQSGFLRSAESPMSIAHTRHFFTDDTDLAIVFMLSEPEKLERTISFPVDSYLKSLDIRVSHNLQAPNVSFPVGVSIDYANITNNGTVKTYHFSNPTPTNLWSFNVTSSAPNWAVTVIGGNDLSVFHGLYSPTPQGYKKISGDPVVGEKMRVYLSPKLNGVSVETSLAMFNGSFTRIVLRNVTSKEFLISYNLRKLNSDPNGHGYRTEDFVVPSYDFDLYVEGADYANLQLQRRLDIVNTSPVGIIPVMGLPVMFPDYSANFTVTISNRGPDDHFIISADSLTAEMTTSQMNPSRFSLASGASINVTTKLSVAQNATPNKEIGIFFTVKSDITGKKLSPYFMWIRVEKVIPPKCTILSSSFAENCTAVSPRSKSCQNYTWSVEMNNFLQGIGPVHINVGAVSKDQMSKSTSLASIVSTSDGNTTVQTKGTGDCCSDTVTVTVTNSRGLSAHCQLQRTLTTTAESLVTTTSSSAPPFSLSVGAIAGIAVVAAGLLLL